MLVLYCSSYPSSLYPPSTKNQKIMKIVLPNSSFVDVDENAQKRSARTPRTPGTCYFHVLQNARCNWSSNAPKPSSSNKLFIVRMIQNPIRNERAAIAMFSATCARVPHVWILARQMTAKRLYRVHTELQTSWYTHDVFWLLNTFQIPPVPTPLDQHEFINRILNLCWRKFMTPSSCCLEI